MYLATPNGLFTSEGGAALAVTGVWKVLKSTAVASGFSSGSSSARIASTFA